MAYEEKLKEYKSRVSDPKVTLEIDGRGVPEEAADTGFIHWLTLVNTFGDDGKRYFMEFVNMTPYGDVINCANNHIYLGNVRQESFALIRERAMKESPFGRYRPCFLTMDQDFMDIYYPLIENKGWVSLDEFRIALKKHEKENKKKVYPELK